MIFKTTTKPIDLYNKLKERGHMISLAHILTGSSVSCGGCNTSFLIERSKSHVMVCTMLDVNEKLINGQKVRFGDWLISQSCIQLAQFHQRCLDARNNRVVNDQKIV